ncbi:dnaj-class molecular chaperone [Vairimorpha apis BRL 01]|uniref:Dnaj-class molecular chaperone n=1 Tax=Vairimorpha apis BRL 01 TaxID=1037528 RepID=T0MJZ7_9MICR|nr:dnaj-class molecular chaperone [Vairimorpha apis BRL 01]
MNTTSNEYLNIKSAIENLHKNTSYSTFYELFGSSRFTKISKIQKNFMKMLRSKKSKQLLTTSFDILKRHRKEYDNIINNYSLMIDDSRNYKTIQKLKKKGKKAVQIIQNTSPKPFFYMVYCKIISMFKKN